MNVVSLLTRSAVRHPGRPAVTVGRHVLATYAQLRDRVSRLAGSICEQLGSQRGQRVGLAMTNSAECLEVLCAIWSAGHTAVPINAKLHSRELAHILGDCGARWCFTSADLEAAVAPLTDEVPTLERVIRAGSAEYQALLASAPAIPYRDVSADDPAWIFYTSGTTGHPKGAVLSHANLLAMTLCYFADVDAIGPRDCIIHGAPMSHGSGLYALPHLARGANHVIPQSGRFDAAEIVSLMREHAGVTLFLAPTMILRLLDEPLLESAAADGLKTLTYGGGPMYVQDLLRAIDCVGPKLVQVYGQGESPMTIARLSQAAHGETGHPRYLERLASTGTAMTAVDVRIVDDGDRSLPQGEIGEVIVRGATVMTRYWNNPEATAETLRGGWLHTGDLAVMDADGFLTLKDRSKDVIISGGANIYPREIEEVLVRHQEVVEAAVVGAPDREWGELVVAYVVSPPGAVVTSAELDRLCLGHMARFKRPRAYRFVQSLPKNNNGKVLKRQLRGNR